MLNRALTLDERVRNSELFPRIRDAERGMVQNEIEFRKKREDERKRKDRRSKVDIKKLALQTDGRAPGQPETHFFTGFVLNKDPSCSKYMPFDEVYFPKLFNKTTQRAPPECINSLWMLGFEDHIQRELQPKPPFVQAVTEMNIGTLSDAESPQKQRKEKKKKKNKKKKGLNFF